MKFLDLEREYAHFNWIEALRPVFYSKAFINGPQVKELEDKISDDIGTEYAIGVSSGTDALMVAIMALEILKPVVLTTPYTFISTVEVPSRLGATVRFCDIDDTFNIDINRVKELIKEEHIDIFIPVHLFGLPVNIDDELRIICKEEGTHIIEDAAQAFGSSVGDKQAGSLGDMGCFSFFPSKNLGCAGDGGMITTNSKHLYEKCKMIRNHGSSKKYIHKIDGGNFRLDTIQAALLIEKIKYVDVSLNIRKNIAKIYNKGLKECNSINVPFYDESNYINHSYNQYVIKVEEKYRDDMKDYLASRDIPTMLYYPSCLSDQLCYKDKNFHCDCNSSKKASKENLALPIGYLYEEEAQNVVLEIKEFLRNK